MSPRSSALFLLAVLPLITACNRPVGQAEPFPDAFAWGAGSASFQGVDLDSETALLLEAVGLTHYRLSIEWERLIPDGTGEVDGEGIAYYRHVLDALAASGMQPMIVLHQWDLPEALEARGGWSNRESVAWFTAYAEQAFDEFGDQVPLWVTVADPYTEGLLRHPYSEAPLTPSPVTDDGALSRAPPFVQARRRARDLNPQQSSTATLATRAAEAHHMILAHARTVELYRSLDLGGRIGIALNLSPIRPIGELDPSAEAVLLEDAVRNRWFLDPLLKGGYPDDVMEHYLQHRELGVQSGDMAFILEQGTDFVGVDYFAPTMVEPDTLSAHLGIRLQPNLDGDKSFFGQADAAGLLDVLTRVSTDYGSPPVYVTANGAGYGPIDEINENGRIRDELRVRFLRRHLVQAQKSTALGVDLRGYFIWSGVDGLGVDGEFQSTGLIHRDPLSGEYYFKDSARYYRSIIANNAVSRMPF